MRDFEFHRPSSVAAAVATARQRPEAKYLGGGQSLIPVMKLGLAAPSDVVTVAGIAELHGVRADGGHVVVGASTTHAEVAASPEVRRAIAALADLAAHIGDAQVRNRGTLGGALAHDDPAADYPAAALALAATVVTDRRTIAADEFFHGMYATALEADELITAVRFPVPEKAAYAKFVHPASRFALVGVFVAKGSHGVRVAVTGAGPSVFRVTGMEEALAARFAPEALSGVAVPSTDLVSDGFASAAYRAHLVGVMARRAMAGCT